MLDILVAMSLAAFIVLVCSLYSIKCAVHDNTVRFGNLAEQLDEIKCYDLRILPRQLKELAERVNALEA